MKWQIYTAIGVCALGFIVFVRTLVRRAIESASEAKSRALVAAYDREIKAEAEKHKAAIDRRVEEKAMKIDKMTPDELEKEFNE